MSTGVKQGSRTLIKCIPLHKLHRELQRIGFLLSRAAKLGLILKTDDWLLSHTRQNTPQVTFPSTPL
ncbi:Uncharacterised protein [Vibrio cholerae]|nr:Uncharacterised protein [Vibrio cholerae]CSC31951.1 Uncharacterised protein [Vibrio cholerae]CSH86175.1 Uncharacterised protein [Vibrio cholerae]